MNLIILLNPSSYNILTKNVCKNNKEFFIIFVFNVSSEECRIILHKLATWITEEKKCYFHLRNIGGFMADF